MRKFNTKAFIKDVLNDKYALVIGNECILDPRIEPTGDVHHYFLRKVNENSSEYYDSYHEIALDKSERINPVRRLIEKGEIHFSANDVSKELFGLLSTKLFTTVLTTTTDGYLETAMRTIWGKELRVVNVYDKETVTDFQEALKKCRREQRYNHPTLIYVFGKLVTDSDSNQGPKFKYVRTDTDAMLLIEKWMRMGVEDDNKMLNFIRSKRLLALGCKFENWYFRFFWYVLTGVQSSEDSSDGMGEVAFTLNIDDKTEGRLLQFLDRTDICVLGDARAFISKLNETLTVDSIESPFRQQIIEARNSGGVFISYCSKDSLAACQLFYQLREKRFDVWLDNARLYGGDNYEKEISEAISAARIIITLLSPHVADDLKRGDIEHYYNKEWRIAQQFDDKVIIPLAIDGYNFKQQYHYDVYQSIINKPSSGIDLMDADGFSKLIASIKDNL